MRYFRITIFTLLAVFHYDSPAISSAELNNLDERIDQARRATNMEAGTAVVVVRDDRIIHEAYFGYSDIEGGVPVSDETLFYIASTTKAFFAMAILMAVERGDVSESTTLAELFPNLDFPHIQADAITVRHLLTHTHGLENEHLTFAGSYTGLHDAALRTLMVAATYASEDAELGEFEYSNLGYNILSVWLENRYGRDWRHTMREWVLDPVGMTHTSAFMSDAQRNNWSVARPYDYRLDGGRSAVYLQKTDSTMYAVGMIARPRDVARYLIAQLNEGRVEGEVVLSPTAIARSHVRQVEEDGPYFDGYAWGWLTKEDNGRRVLFHTGGFVGAAALISFMPDEGIGIVVLHNESGIRANYLNGIIENGIYDMLVGNTSSAAVEGEIIERIGRMTEYHREALAENLSELAALEARPSTLRMPPAEYAGHFMHPLSGEIEVIAEGNALTFKWGNLRGRAFPGEEADSVVVEFRPGSRENLSFRLQEHGVVGLSVHGFEFVRR